MTFSVAKELIRRGHTVAVLTGFPAAATVADADRHDEYDLEGMHVYRFHHAYVAMGGQEVVTEIEYDNHLATQHFTQILAHFKPDVVHFFHMIRLGIRLIDAAVSAGIPAFYTPTDFWSICPTAQLLLPNGKVCSGPSFFAGNCVKHFAQFRGGSRAQKVAPYVPDLVADVIAGLVKHDILPPHPVSREIKAMAQRKAFMIARLNWLDGIVSPTRFMTKVITENGADTRLIVNSGFGIDLTGYDIPAPEVKAGTPLTIGFIGTLAPHKGCHILIEAFKLLPRGSARLKIYGNLKDFAEYNASLRQRAAGFDDIEFCGTFPNGDIGHVLAGLDVLVVPSMWFENSPLVVQSALAAKRPVIASDFPGLSDIIIDNLNGMTFRPGDFKALHARLKRLISEPTLLARLSSNCEPPKSTPAYVDELLALYKNSPRSAIAAAERGSRLTPDLDTLRQLGFLRGWAVVGLKAPARVTLRVGNKLLGETKQFYPRPDVQERVQSEGGEIKSDRFGFTMRLPNGIDRRDAVICCEDANGRMISLPLRDVASGDTLRVGDGDYISISSEHLTWQVDQSGLLRGWASVGLAPPVRVAVRADNATLGETIHFLKRPDVRTGLTSEGHSVSAEDFGFSIFLPSGIDRNQATIYCEDGNGRTITLPLRDIANGHRASLGNGDFVAIESERLPRRAAEPRG